MNDTKIASKAKAQLAHFMGKVFTRFSKPAKKFIEECICGIQASGDTKLSSIVRAIDDDTRPIYTEKRLSRNMASLVLASAYFATVWIGRNIRREVLAEHQARLGKRLGEVPEFAAYAIADGIRRAFTRFGKWVRTAAKAIAEKPETETAQLLPGFAELFDTDDG